MTKLPIHLRRYIFPRASESPEGRPHAAPRLAALVRRCVQPLRIPGRFAIARRHVFLMTLVAACTLPLPIGLAYPPALARATKPANSVGTLFTALSRCRASLPESERWRIAGVIHHESQKYGYDPLFVMAMVEVESACSPTARGRRGAIGLIQVKPSTARAIAADAGMTWAGTQTLARPTLNVRLGLYYLHQLEERFDDLYLAIAAYNLGPTKVASMPPQRARGAKYVKKILARYNDLLAQHTVDRS